MVQSNVDSNGAVSVGTKTPRVRQRNLLSPIHEKTVKLKDELMDVRKELAKKRKKSQFTQ